MSYTRVKVLKWALLGVIGIILIGGTGVFWVLSRPTECKIELPGPTGYRVKTNAVFGNYFPAHGKKRAPAVLLLGGSEGGLSSAAKRQAVSLQSAGISTLQLAYHCAPGKPNKLARVPLESLSIGVDWLKARPEVASDAVGVIGYSKGAEAALLLATRRSDLKAVILGMPSHVVWDGIGPMAWVRDRAQSSWIENGKDVPSLPYGSTKSDRGAVYGLHSNGLKRLSAFTDSILPVERVRSPLLLLCGELDRIWPSCAMADEISRRLRAAGRPAPELIRFPDAGHDIFGPPSTGPIKDPSRTSSAGGTLASNLSAKRRAWPRVVQFTRDALRQDTVSSPE